MSNKPSKSQIAFDFVREHFGKHASVIMIAEAGSTAKGYAGPDSDADLRVIAQRPEADYLKLYRPRDNFEVANYADGVDICAYDVTKALQLIAKSNPNVSEWLRTTPILKAEPYYSILKTAYRDCLSPYTLALAYRGNGKQCIGRWLNTTNVSTKVLLQSAYNALALNWVLSEHEEPPILIQDLMTHPNASGLVCDAVTHLLGLRQTGIETTPDIPVLNQFIRATIDSDIDLTPDHVDHQDYIEETFHKLIVKRRLSVLR